MACMFLLQSFVMILAIKKVDSEMMKPSMWTRPPNNHGIQPTVLINEEVKLSRGNLLTIIPILSTEWIVTLDVRFMKLPFSWKNVIRFTNNPASDYEEYGQRAPFVHTTPDNKFHICSAVNGIVNYYHDHINPINLNQTYHIEIHQRYIANNEYKYFIVIDGVEVHSVVNTDARQFYNVHVYAGDGLYDAADAYVSDFKYVNFL